MPHHNRLLQRSFNPYCPSGGSWYICTGGSNFVGCCSSDPCTIGCPARDLFSASFDPAAYGTFPDQQCESGSWYTCRDTQPAFLGCCKSNPCTSGCPRQNLAGGFLSLNPKLAGEFVSEAGSTGSVETTVISSGTGTASVRPTTMPQGSTIFSTSSALVSNTVPTQPSTFTVTRRTSTGSIPGTQSSTSAEIASSSTLASSASITSITASTTSSIESISSVMTSTTSSTAGSVSTASTSNTLTSSTTPTSSSTPTSTANPQSTTATRKASPGAVAGIVIGCIALFCLFFCLFLWCYRRQNKKLGHRRRFSSEKEPRTPRPTTAPAPETPVAPVFIPPIPVRPERAAQTPQSSTGPYFPPPPRQPSSSRRNVPAGGFPSTRPRPRSRQYPPTTQYPPVTQYPPTRRYPSTRQYNPRQPGARTDSMMPDTPTPLRSHPPTPQLYEDMPSSRPPSYFRPPRTGERLSRNVPQGAAAGFGTQESIRPVTPTRGRAPPPRPPRPDDDSPNWTVHETSSDSLNIPPDRRPSQRPSRRPSQRPTQPSYGAPWIPRPPLPQDPTQPAPTGGPGAAPQASDEQRSMWTPSPLDIGENTTQPQSQPQAPSENKPTYDSSQGRERLFGPRAQPRRPIPERWMGGSQAVPPPAPTPPQFGNNGQTGGESSQESNETRF